MLMDELAGKYIKVLEFLKEQGGIHITGESITDKFHDITRDDLYYLGAKKYINVPPPYVFILDKGGQNYLDIYYSKQKEKADNERIQVENRKQQHKVFIWTVIGTIFVILTFITSIILLLKR
jgi:hypothetical protein